MDEGVTSAMKAATIMLSLGSAGASKVYQHLNEDEVEALTLEIAKMESMSQETTKEIVDDFYGLCITKKTIADGGVFFARETLEKAFGPELASQYMDRIAGAMKSRAFEFLRKADHRNLMMILQSEHPQIIAFVLSYTRAEQSSKIISLLPKEMQYEVIKRIATLESVSPEIVNVVEETLHKHFTSLVSVDMTEIGGVNYVADIMNHTDRTTEKYIFDELGKNDPQLSEDIRKLMFVFEDITNLGDVEIQRVLRDVDTQQLAIAIKGSSDEVKERLLANISSRAREGILEDIKYLRNVRLKDVEAAQTSIVNVIRALEESGEIVISRGGEEDAIID